MVVFRNEPAPDFICTIQPILTQMAESHPQWRDRLELGFVTRQAIQAVLDGDESSHRVGRVSPDKPLHLVTADRHRLLDWEAALRGKAIYSASPTEAIPPIPANGVHRVVLEHLPSWPTWLAESDGTGYQAYAVLTVSRAAAYSRLTVASPNGKALPGQQPGFQTGVV